MYGQTVVLFMKDESYKVSDLGVGACFIANGAVLIDLRSIDARRVAFVFQKDETLAEQERKFWSGELQVSARNYFLAIKELKSRLHAYNREQL